VWGWVRDNELPSGVGTAFVAYTSAQKTSILKKLLQGRMGGRLLPTTPATLAAVAAVGTAYVGWRVYQHFTGGDQTLDMWLNSEALGANSLYNLALLPGPYQNKAAWSDAFWQRVTGVGEGACPASIGVSACWRLVLNPTWTSGFGTNTYRINYAIAPGGVYLGTCNTGTAQNCDGYYQLQDYTDHCVTNGYCTATGSPGYQVPNTFSQQLLYAVEQTSDNLNAVNPDVLHVANGVGPNSDPYYGDYLTDEDLQTAIRQVDRAETFAPSVTTDYTVPADQGTQADLEAALAPFDNPCGRAWINFLANPTLYGYPASECGATETLSAPPEPASFALPKPELYETYTDYVTRLEGLGFVGTATGVPLTETNGDPTQGPNTVVRVEVVGGNTYARIGWPAGTGPEVETDAELRISYNPGTYAPVQTDPAEGGVGSGGGCGPYLEASVDFSPLTGIELGDKFPFGLFTWAGGILETFQADPVAPNWTIALPIPAVIGDDIDYTVDLAVWDTYMEWFRTLISWVLWLGFVWYVATTFLGLRVGGNPAEAIDDVYGDGVL